MYNTFAQRLVLQLFSWYAVCTCKLRLCCYAYWISAAHAPANYDDDEWVAAVYCWDLLIT